jgi:MFS family permease
MTLYHRDIFVIVSVALSTFLGMVAMSGINISLPMIVKEFDTSLSHAAWVVNGYLLIMAGCIIIIGKMADRRGLKKTFLQGILIFSLGSLLCSFSWDLHSLIGSRVVQALGASMFFASGPALIATQVSDMNQGKGQAINSAFAPIGAAVGIGFAGIVTGLIGWRSVFLLSIPIGIVIYLIGRTILSETTVHRISTPFDIRGSILIFSTVVLFLAGCTLIYIPSSGVAPMLVFGCSLGTGVAFLYHQKRWEDSALTISLFKNRHFSFALLSSFFVYSLYAGLNYFTPLILVYHYYLSSADSGIYLMAVGLGSTLFALQAGKLADQRGSRIICIGACGIIILALLALTSIPQNVMVFILLFFIFRIGFMLFSSPSTKQILDHCPGDQKGSGSGIMQASRYFAYTIGIAVLCIVFEIVVFQAGLVNDGTAIVNRLTPELARLGILSIFSCSLILAIFGLIFCILTRDRIVQAVTGESGKDESIGGNTDTMY